MKMDGTPLSLRGTRGPFSLRASTASPFEKLSSSSLSSTGPCKWPTFFRPDKMLRSVVRLCPNIMIPLFTHKNEFDHDVINHKTPNTPQSGWDRVKAMYSISETEELSIELTNAMQSSFCGAFIGACLGGFVSSRVAYINFIENNQATIFKTTAEAKKRLQDSVTISFAKGAYRWGWRLWFFTGIFSLTANTISVYRGDTSLVEYITAGAITGALFKMDMGFAAIFVGSGLGAALSAIAGIAILGVLKVAGVSMREIMEAINSIEKAREDQFNQVLEKSAQIKNDELTDHHKMIVAIKGEQKIDDLPD